MVNKKLPKKVWGIGINLNGPWAAKPFRLIYDYELDEWYDKAGDLGVKKLGVHRHYGVITFASESKHEVEIFIAGMKAASQTIINVAWMGLPKDALKAVLEEPPYDDKE
jgi:hypothetical protein